MILGLGTELQKGVELKATVEMTNTKTIIKPVLEFKLNHFFILGNGHSGSSLLRGLLHAHSKVHVEFENSPKRKTAIEKVFDDWSKIRLGFEKDHIIWGNKIPIEQFRTAHWTNDTIMQIIENGYRVIWLQRRFSKYNEHYNNTRQTEEYRERWKWGRDLYWKMKEAYPSKIIQVSFEDLLFQPRSELTRICTFLDIEYEQGMITDGPSLTGHYRYKNKEIDTSKI